MKQDNNQISQFETQADTFSKTKHSLEIKMDVVMQLVTELDEIPNTVATRTLQDVTNDEMTELSMHINKN